MKNLLIVGIIALILGGIGFGMYVSYTNTEITKRETTLANKKHVRQIMTKCSKLSHK